LGTATIRCHTTHFERHFLGLLRKAGGQGMGKGASLRLGQQGLAKAPSAGPGQGHGGGACRGRTQLGVQKDLERQPLRRP